MPFMLDDANVRDLVDSIVGPHIEESEVRAVIATMQLAASIDSHDNRVLDTLIRRMCEIGDIERVGPLSPVPMDDEERATKIVELADRLPSPEARELAYVLAHLAIVGDLQIAPIESRFMRDLRDAFGIDPERAAELVQRADVRVTPGGGVEAHP